MNEGEIMQRTTVHETWSSRTVFLLAAIGSAVGLGNIQRFPQMVGENGGGAFVLIYLICVFVIGVPLLMAELMIGRRGRQSAITTMRLVAVEEGHSPRWTYLGWLGVLIAFFVLTFYSVIAGWGLDYMVKSLVGQFAGLDAARSNALFNGLLADPLRLAFWHAVFIGLSVFVVARGVHKGLEAAVNILMPMLFIILLGLVGYAMVKGDFMAGVNFLFAPDFSKITGKVIMLAVGQSFFTLTLGAGAMMTYGAYLPQNVSIPRAVSIIALSDTAVALLAGLALFPIVFAFGLDPNSGSGLAFVTLPVAFGQMTGGTIVGALFFMLLVIAALTSIIATLEPLVAWGEEHRGFKRSTTAIVAGIIAWVLGTGTVFSFNIWKGFYPLGWVPGLEGKTIFGLMDFLTITIALPISGFLIAIFAGWRMRQSSSREELGLAEGLLYKTWLFLVRIVAPLALIAVFFGGLFSS